MANQSLTPSEAFETFFSATEASDLDRFFGLLDDDVVMRFPYMLPGYPNEIRGREVCSGFFGSVVALFSGLRWIKPTVYSTNDPELAMATTASSAKLHNGTVYENEYVLLIRVRNGAIVEYCEFFDPNRAVPVFEALGA